jgi:hypothetical protein
VLPRTTVGRIVAERTALRAIQDFVPYR